MKTTLIRLTHGAILAVDGDCMETMLNRYAFLEGLWSSGVTFIADNRVTRHVLPARMRRSN